MDELDITKLIQKQEEQTITEAEYQQLKNGLTHLPTIKRLTGITASYTKVCK